MKSVQMAIEIVTKSQEASNGPPSKVGTIPWLASSGCSLGWAIVTTPGTHFVFRARVFPLDLVRDPCSLSGVVIPQNSQMIFVVGRYHRHSTTVTSLFTGILIPPPVPVRLLFKAGRPFCGGGSPEPLPPPRGGQIIFLLKDALDFPLWPPFCGPGTPSPSPGHLRTFWVGVGQTPPLG